jgi:hypothetical protein
MTGHKMEWSGRRFAGLFERLRVETDPVRGRSTRRDWSASMRTWPASRPGAHGSGGTDPPGPPQEV